jgi:hypothetical protein
MSSARAQKGRFAMHKKQRAYLVTQTLCRKAALQILLGKKTHAYAKQNSGC